MPKAQMEFRVTAAGFQWQGPLKNWLRRAAAETPLRRLMTWPN